MSQAMKALSNLSVTNPLRYGLVRYMCFGKDLIKSTSAPGPDFLLQNLRNSSSPKTVLKIVNEHYNIMNSKHIMQALRSLFDLQKCGCPDMSTKDVLRHPDFDKLCKKLKSQSGVIELNETIEALKVISYVGVPSSSTIVQVLLQLVRQNINSLSLHHIIFLDFLISQFKSCPLVDALKIALPLVFEIHLPLKMDKDNVTHLAEYLHYAAKANLSVSTIDTIVKALYQSNEEFDAKIAKSIIWSITDMEADETFEPLMKKAINDLIIHIDSLNYSDMESTLSRLVHKYTIRCSFFYNETFVDTCANYIIDHNLGFKHAVYTLRKLGRIAHINKYLLDYTSKIAWEDPSCIENADPADIYSIAIAVSLTDYRPVHWENLKKLITKKKNLAAENRREIIWLRFAASLCLLDIYKFDVLSRALIPDYLNALFRKGFKSDFENYFAIWQSIKIHRPEFTDVLPSKYEPENIIDRAREIPDFPLESSLQKGLGGEQYVLSNLASKKGHQIDHAVLFRKGGYPIAVDKESKFIEDIETSSENEQLLLILALRPIHYTINTKEIREATSLSIKTLEMDGHSVVIINLEVWESLSDFEKIPYLMQAIKTKVDKETSISEGVV